MIEFHPLAALFPLLDGDDLAALVQSIRSVGQLQKITLHDGMILDGRNRYLACLKAGIEPDIEQLPADRDPLEFVYGQNIHRRHLTISQKALALAEYTKLKRGRPKNSASGANNCTQAQAATDAGISTGSIKRARSILLNGTADEVASVRNGDSSARAVDASIRSRKRAERKADPAIPMHRSNSLLRIPDGFASISAAAQVGIDRERAGASKADARKASGLAYETYNVARDVVLLQGRDDLTEGEAALMREALHELDEMHNVTRAQRIAKPIALKVWGHSGHRFKTDKRRAENFSNAIFFVVSACTNGAEMPIPAIDRAQRKETLQGLGEAIAALRALCRRVKAGG